MHVISPDDAETLQHNIVRSHACSVGDPLNEETVRVIYNQVRNSVATVDEDRHFGPDIEAIYQLIRAGEIVETIESQIGQIAF